MTVKFFSKSNLNSFSNISSQTEKTNNPKTRKKVLPTSNYFVPLTGNTINETYLDDFLKPLLFDAHIFNGVQQGETIRKPLLHLLDNETAGISSSTYRTAAALTSSE